MEFCTEEPFRAVQAVREFLFPSNGDHSRVNDVAGLPVDQRHTAGLRDHGDRLQARLRGLPPLRR